METHLSSVSPLPNIMLLISGPLSTPTCPYCRQRMTVLLPFFSDVERNAADLDAATIESRQKLYQNIRSYNRLFSGDTSNTLNFI